MKRLFGGVAVCCALALGACGGGHHSTSKPKAHVATSTSSATTSTATPPNRQGGVTRPTNFGQPPKGDYGLSTNQFGAGYLLTGYDAVTLSYIPRSASVVGCYDSGAYPNCGSAEADFPHAHIVTVATNAGAEARCLDLESGDAVPDQAPGWIRWELSLHVWQPCLYSPAGEMVTVEAYMRDSGIPRGEYMLWVADWDDNPNIPDGFQAKQWESNCCIDHDTFSSSFFASAPPPPPPNPEYYSRYDNTRRVFRNAKHKVVARARERATVETWDKRGCRNPVKRTVCKTSKYHLQLLQSRLVSVAYNTGKKPHPNWSQGKPTSIGDRNQEIIHRLTGSGIVKSWSAGL